ncbi:MAG: methylmalonyl-CoA mutase subunit beta [Aestuariibaculum sp.]
MTKGLFSEFQPVSAKQWKQKIQFELNGADYNKTLVWNSTENIAVKPFYHADNFTPPTIIPHTQATQWQICQTIFVSDVIKSNKNAIEAIQNGVESLKFIISSPKIQVNELLKNIDLKRIPLFFELQFLNPEFVDHLFKISTKSHIVVTTDIIGHLAKTGNWYDNLKSDFSNLKTIVNCGQTISIDSSLYQNAGANMVQQLAYTLAHANEYLFAFEKDLNTNQKIHFQIAVGSNYFFEIAKIRALRILWNTLALEYNINPHCHIFAMPSKRNKTIYDSYNNMLRSTTECMSAILGGADTINNLAFDATYKKTNRLSNRLANNQLLILKEESFFKKVNNPANGSYYIETLTQQLAEKALTLFKDIEANGGFLKQLKNGTIQRKIKESALIEEELFNIEKEVLIGVNKYKTTDESIKSNLELYPFVKTKHRKTLIVPIIEKRLAETLEQTRLNPNN